jgi:hypothetical protein
MTRNRRRLALIAGALMLTGGAGSGIAMASSPTAALSHPASVSAQVNQKTDAADPGETAKGPDKDNVQSGDQTSPDTGISGKTNGESGNTSETGPSDGPGGHADTGSNTNHQFSGKE